VRRVGKATMGEGVARKQVAVFVVVVRQWNARDGNYRGPNCKQRQTDQENGEVTPGCDSLAESLDALQTQRFPKCGELLLQIYEERN
jgi:hypothetical protein